MKYPRFYGSHFSDFEKIGKIVAANQLSDTVSVQTVEHTLLYEGRMFGSLCNRGWELVRILDSNKNELNLNYFVEEEIDI